MRFNITSESNVASGLGKLIAAGADMSPLYDAIGQTAVTSTIERFGREEAPDGTQWPKSHRASRDGGKTLQDTGILKDSINHQVESDGVFIGTPFGWAVAHQEGMTIRAKNAPYLMFRSGDGFARVKEVTLPKREMFGVSTSDEAEFLELLDAHYGGAA